MKAGLDLLEALRKTQLEPPKDGEYTAYELAEKLGCNPRTARKRAVEVGAIKVTRRHPNGKDVAYYSLVKKQGRVRGRC